MLVTQKFVYIHQPKTGGTFVSALLTRLHEARGGTATTIWVDPARPAELPPLASNDVLTVMLTTRKQHGARRDIPAIYRDRPILATVRNPYDRYVSQYEFAWWRRHAELFGPVADVTRRYPSYPDLTFEQFVYLTNEMALPYRSANHPADTPGRHTQEFVKLFFRHPDAAYPRLLDATFTATVPDDELQGIRFVDQTRLNDELAELLTEWGYPASEVRAVRDAEPIWPPGSGRDPGSAWEPHYTPELKTFVRHKERWLFEWFPRWQAETPMPTSEIPMMPPSRPRAKINPLMVRPLRAEDLPPVPAGWNTKLPDFVGIASGKAGTSWWYGLLLAHPAIKPNRPRAKELCYFNHFGYRAPTADDAANYREAFAAPEGCLCGEWSPGYLHHPFAIDHLAKVAPGVKLLAMVRNPVDRVVSALNQMLSVRVPFMNLPAEQDAVFRVFNVFPSVIANSSLHEPFRRLLQLFDRSQLLVLQYERCSRDPAAQIAKTYEFLGVDAAFVPPNLRDKVNVHPPRVPELTSTERRLLAEYFAADVQAFSKLFPAIDLSLWPDFLGAFR